MCIRDRYILEYLTVLLLNELLKNGLVVGGMSAREYTRYFILRKREQKTRDLLYIRIEIDSRKQRLKRIRKDRRAAPALELFLTPAEIEVIAELYLACKARKCPLAYRCLLYTSRCV